MAGSGRRVFAPGEVLTASNVMNYLQDQAVMTFAGTAARGSAIGTAAAAGMTTYLKDNNFVQLHDGTSYRSIGGVQRVENATVRDAVLPAPIQGDSVFRTDLGLIETYFGLYNSSTNPGGRDAAGWYRTTRAIGLTPIVPPTVNFSGGSATSNSMGVISFSGVTSISLNNAFYSNFSSYKIFLGLQSSTASGVIKLRFRSSGTDNSASQYFTSAVKNSTGTISGWGANYDTSLSINYMSTSFGNAAYSELNIFQPATTAFKTYGSINAMTNDGNIYSGIAGALAIDNNLSFDGFTIFAATGNITGTVQVLGYNY